VRRLIATALLISIVGLAGIAGQVPGIIADVRKAIAANDFVLGDKLLASYRAANGVTPEMLEALSWMGRGSLAAKQLDNAEKYARETYQLATAELKRRKLDQESRLPIALGAAIEVLAQTDAARGARSEAIVFLNREIAAYEGTSIEKRLRKNLNLLSLEGRPAPAIDVSEYLGAKPPTVAELKGKPVLMFFWAHWCGDCKAQSPILARLVDTYGPKGLVLFAPTQRFGYVAGGKTAPADEETRYIEQIRQTYYPVLLNQPVPIGEANHMRYGVSTTPTLVLVDRAGIIRLYHPGRMTWEELEPLVKSLVTS
jgi:thiol-disulfide isomerase/thioredoxin